MGTTRLHEFGFGTHRDETVRRVELVRNGAGDRGLSVPRHVDWVRWGRNGRRVGERRARVDGGHLVALVVLIGARVKGERLASCFAASMSGILAAQANAVG